MTETLLRGLYRADANASVEPLEATERAVCMTVVLGYISDDALSEEAARRISGKLLP